MGAHVHHDLGDKYPAYILRLIPGGNGLASGRPWCLTHPEDVIRMHGSLRPHVAYIERHYARVGLPVTTRIVWDTGAPVETPSDLVPSTLCTDDPQNTYRMGIGDKNVFMRLCEKLRIRIPNTHFSDDPTYLYPSFPLMYKRADGARGIGIVCCTTPEEVHKAIREHGAYYQLQETLPAVAWLTVQCVAAVGTAEHLATTEEVLEGYTHVGDVFPTLYDAWSVVAPLATHLAQCGVRDVLEFNVAVVPGAETHVLLPVSCRRGMSSTTYPTLLRHELGARAWSARTVHTTRRAFEGLDLTDIEYDRTRNCGMVLINWGTIAIGRLDVACYGTPEEQCDLYRLLGERL